MFSEVNLKNASRLSPLIFFLFSVGGNNGDTSYNMTRGTSGSSNEVKNAFFTNRGVS